LALRTIKLRVFFVAVALLIATTLAHGSNVLKNNTLRLSTFNSKESAQKFYRSIPEDARIAVKKEQLWLSISQNAYDFGLYHMRIKNNDY